MGKHEDQVMLSTADIDLDLCSREVHGYSVPLLLLGVPIWRDGRYHDLFLLLSVPLKTNSEHFETDPIPPFPFFPASLPSLFFSCAFAIIFPVNLVRTRDEYYLKYEKAKAASS